MQRILVIEDNPDIRENLTELLELAGYLILAAENGKVGLEIASRELPDLILCDVMMPVLDGHQVFDSVKTSPTMRNIPFVFITSSVEKKDIQYALKKGANAYISKPFEERELFETIRDLLKY